MNKTGIIINNNSLLSKIIQFIYPQSENEIFEKELSKEILKSDRIRVIVISVLSYFFAAWAMMEHHSTMHAHNEKMVSFVSFMIFMVLGTYELLNFFLIKRIIRKNLKLPVVISYFNSFIEISIPTALVFMTSHLEGALDGLYSSNIFFYFLFISVSILQLNFLLCFFQGIVACVEYYFMSSDVLSHVVPSGETGKLFSANWHAERAFIFLLMGLIAGFITLLLRKRVANSIKKVNEMTESFSRFVPKEFLRYLNRDDIVNVKLGDQVMREMTVLFSDIRSFTSISEKMTPQENIDFLNSYLMSMSPIIRKSDGFIDKFIGDAIMALFDSPDKALEAAVSMQKQVAEFNAVSGITGGLPISIGIGIHTGKLMLGTIGEMNRIDTTVISDAVNIASRLESLNKKFGSGIIISRTSFDKLAFSEKFKCRDLGMVEIHGRKETLSAMEILPE